MFVLLVAMVPHTKQRDIPSSTVHTTEDTEHLLTEQGQIQATKKKSFIKNNLSWVITVPSLLLITGIAGIVVHVCKKKRIVRRRKPRKDNNPPNQEHAQPLMPLRGMFT